MTVVTPDENSGCPPTLNQMGSVAHRRLLAANVLTFNALQQFQITRSDVAVTVHANRSDQIVASRGRVVQERWKMEGPHGWMSLLLQSLAFWEMPDASTDQAVENVVFGVYFDRSAVLPPFLPRCPAMSKQGLKQAIKVSANVPERNDGSRLISLPNGVPRHPTYEYYLELADIALGLRKPESQRTRLSRQPRKD